MQMSAVTSPMTQKTQDDVIALQREQLRYNEQANATMLHNQYYEAMSKEWSLPATLFFVALMSFAAIIYAIRRSTARAIEVARIEKTFDETVEEMVDRITAKVEKNLAEREDD
jgi:hypothetical protein